MRELIGECKSCGDAVYCENGFFDGEQIDGNLYCNHCAEKLDSETDKQA